MCIDLQKFTAELKAKNDVVRKIEAGICGCGLRRCAAVYSCNARVSAFAI